MSRGDSSINVSVSDFRDGGEQSLNLQELVRAGRSFSARERNCCFLNTGSPHFADISAVSGLDFPDDGRAAARVDWDHDGDLDLWISNRNSPQVRFARNDTPHNHHFLAIKLEGRTSNRDAIGARLELSCGETNPRTMIQTLRCGDGYLSQSSKWVHFGLGQDTHIDPLVVRWPGGDEEVFRGLSVDQRYVIVQGSGSARAVPDPVAKTRLNPARLNPLPAEGTMHTFLASRISMPQLRYESLDDQVVELRVTDRRSLLVNLWASWCEPCLSELRELTAASDRIRQCGLDILALSVDGITDRSTAAADARVIVELQNRFPFRSGRAPQELITKLQIIRNQLFDRHTDIGLPASFLLDANGDLAVIYQGRVDVDTLLSDVAKLDLDAEQTRQASLPFQGCWLMEQARIPLVPVFRELLRHEFRDDAMEYMVRNRQRFPADIASVAGLLNDGAKLLNEGQLESAEQRFRWAILLDAQCSPAYMQLGRTLHRQGRISESEAALRQSLAIDAENVTTHFALGLLLKEIRRSAEAAESLRKVAQLRPDHIPTMFHLADILATDSNTSDGNDREANSREAILWAEKAAGLTNRQSADVLAVLAAAYAQAGRWNDAISTAEEARRVAIDTNKTNLRQQIEQNLEAYRGFRIPPPAAHRPNSSTSDVAP